jgi:TolB-like protein
LIEAREQTDLSSATYDRDLRDAFEVRTELTRQMGEALAHGLFPD